MKFFGNRNIPENLRGSKMDSEIWKERTEKKEPDNGKKHCPI